MASSSSSSPSLNIQENYDVFLSFRGEDTRDKFVSHLYAALCKKQILTFFDEDGLQRGEYISSALFEAIEESKISVIVFSKNYASSTWCLNELVEILKRKKTVIPVFYDVTPSDLRKQTGSFGDAFVDLEKRFHEEPQKVNSWRTALTEASNIKGWRSEKDKPESKLVTGVVDDILKILMNNMSPSNYPKFLVGMEEHVKRIKLLLSKHQGVVICGMGGIGKTTIAEVVYQQFSSQFDGCSFILNVREEVEKQDLVRLKARLLSKILNDDEKSITIETLNIIPAWIQRRVTRKRVLIVLDDVYDKEQLESLVRGLKFGLGSKVIVTSRNKNVPCEYKYEVKELDYEPAFKLFCHHAFKHNPPGEYFEELSKKIIHLLQGHPLALEVLGSSLCGKGKEEWESKLKSLPKGDSDDKIYKVLLISYKGLDDEEKKIFLDIAFFFKGWDYEHVTKILNGCYNSLNLRLRNLIDKFVITKTTYNMIQMHDLLQEMGWKIVRQESSRKGERSRLCNEDAFQVLKNNNGTDAVQGLFIDLSKTTDADFSPDAFKKMCNLKFLNFYVSKFENGVDMSSIKRFNKKLRKVEYLSNELRYLHWYGCPLEEFPSTFSPENLVELALPYSKLKKLWKGRKNLSQLISFDLHDSELLTEIPDLSDAVHLKDINLQNCKILEKFPVPDGSYLKFSEYICFLPSLIVLDLSRTNIRSLPPNLKELSKLKELRLTDCRKLESIPNIPGSLMELLAMNCKRLQSLPTFAGSGRVDLSELTTPNDYKGAHNFEFTNCLNLNLSENTKNFFLEGVQLRHHLDNEKLLLARLRLCLPGRDIPDWMSHRSDKSSLTIDLTQYRSNNAFIGFILCAVADMNTNGCPRSQHCSSNDLGSQHFPSISFCTRHPSWKKFGSKEKTVVYSFKYCFDKKATGFYDRGTRRYVYGFPNSMFRGSDHLFLTYCPYLLDLIIGGKYDTLVIKFTIGLEGSRLPVRQREMKCCGACPVFLDTMKPRPNILITNQVAEELQVAQPSISIKNAVETADHMNTNESASHTSDEEETESASLISATPCRKRKFNEI